MDPHDQELNRLALTVQRNCHLTDALHASNYSLCIYLLKMREYYRWEHRLPFSEPLQKHLVGDWLSEREQLWERIAESAYEPLLIDGQQFDPFDTQRINQLLNEKGLIYSGGLGNHCHPHFFLGKLHQRQQQEEYQVLISSTEHARDLTAPPAMSLDKTIFIRRESLRRMIWERLEEWRWNRGEGAMSRALGHYNFDSHLQESLEAMTDVEADTLLLHEIGEIEAGKLLGENWHEMLASLPRSSAELMARAVRDHLADCISTLPALLEQSNHAPLHFYFGNFKGMRREIFPGLMNAYQQWADNGTLEPLQNMVEAGCKQWQDLAKQLLVLFQQHGAQCTHQIEQLVQKNRL